jgi:aryl-alcohol dehydrogenase-like predicted oxidoreductase
VAETRLERRPLGATGLTVSALGMGCAKLGAFWQGRSPADGRRALDAALDAGVTLFDTADCYARGISERLVGRALRGAPDALVCTKVGLLKTPAALLLARRSGGEDLRLSGLARGGAAAGCWEPSYVVAAVERSLRRLGRERVDVLLLHAPPAETIRAQRFAPALAGLVERGKVRAVGLSCATAETADAALEVPGLTCLQIPFSAARRDLLEHVLAPATGRGIGIMGAGPFGDAQLLAPGGDARELLRTALAEPGLASVVAGMARPEHVRTNVAVAAGA